MAPSKASAATAPFSKDERVLCFHHEMLYEAKVLDSRPTEDGLSFQYKIHYKGWKNTVSQPCVKSLRRLNIAGPSDQSWKGEFKSLPYEEDSDTCRPSIVRLGCTASRQTPKRFPFLCQVFEKMASSTQLVECVSNHVIEQWDDWVPQDRVRKFTEENKELAAQLHNQMKALQKQPKAGGKKGQGGRANGSDFSSARGSEERTASVAAQSGRGGQRRGRDYEIENVSPLLSYCYLTCACLFLQSWIPWIPWIPSIGYVF